MTLQCAHCGVTASYADASITDYVGDRCDEAPERGAGHEWEEADR